MPICRRRETSTNSAARRRLLEYLHEWFKIFRLAQRIHVCWERERKKCREMERKKDIINNDHLISIERIAAFRSASSPHAILRRPNFIFTSILNFYGLGCGVSMREYIKAFVLPRTICGRRHFIEKYNERSKGPLSRETDMKRLAGDAGNNSRYYTVSHCWKMLRKVAWWAENMSEYNYTGTRKKKKKLILQINFGAPVMNINARIYFYRYAIVATGLLDCYTN